MSKIVNSTYRYLLYNRTVRAAHHHQITKRTFLSNAYNCQEVWNSRLKSPILQKVHIDELYHELDNNFNKIKNISAVDVDIFANALQKDDHVDELLDLIHKLRLSADTCNTLPSTEHAVIRFLHEHGHHEKLLQVLDDRLNYGIFLDDYTASLLLDVFWKKKDFTSGAKVASQVMLQEDFKHPFVAYLSLLHCFKYLQNPVNWEEPPKPEEPAEEVKVRVKFIRNPYFDDHFDLVKPNSIVGKTLVMASEVLKDEIGASFNLLGLGLQNKDLDLKSTPSVVKEIFELIPEEVKSKIGHLKQIDINVTEVLENKIKEAAAICMEKGVPEQSKIYQDWLKLREDALEKQQKRLDTIQRLADLETKQETLKQREKLLWYFDNKEQIELEIEDKKVFYPKRWFGKKKKPRQVDESYIPPEVQKSYSKEN